MSEPLFALVAGEPSGDTLGADLMVALRALYPNARFEGVGGPKMIAEGFNSLYPMDRLSVMGFVEPLKRLPELMTMRSQLVNRFFLSRPDAFIGIDSPDFNLGIEKRLHWMGIKTVHYVSPSVWAWRQGRIKNIKRSVDLMLTLLPFEASFYQQHGVPVEFVGHPLASQLPLSITAQQARAELQLSADGPLLCIMPGSRSGEVATMAPLFLQVAQQLAVQVPGLQLVIPAADSARYQQLTELLKAFPNLQVTLLQQQAHQAMTAADAVLLTSGTTALEAMLIGAPMVVSYKLGTTTYKLVSKLVKTPYVSLPNLLADQMLVPELLQDQATVEALTESVIDSLNPDKRAQLQRSFAQLKEQIALPSGQMAAQAVAELLDKSKRWSL